MMSEKNGIKLCDLLAQADVDLLHIEGKPDRLVTDIGMNSSRAMEDSMFVAIKGTRHDGHYYLSDAVEKGARTLVVDRELRHYPGTTLVHVSNTKDALGKIAHAFYGNPSRGMKLAAVTGTNGKTSVTWIMNAILESAGYNSAIIGTLGTVSSGEQILSTNNTTPDQITLARHFAELKDRGIDAVIMEASSHGIDQYRVAGIQFDTCALTNITRDHLDYHPSFDDYVSAKQELFSKYLKPNGTAVLNVDDASGRKFEKELQQGICSFGKKKSCSIQVSSITHHPGHTGFVLKVGSDKIQASFPLVGEFSVYNAAAAVGLALNLGLSLKEIEKGLNAVRPVPGRYELINEQQPFVVAVDYSHTPDALEQTLATAKRLTSSRVITVFGCGGDRDQSKRPLMAKAVERHSDYAIMTSDNPRNEDPLEIVRDMKAGVSKMRYEVILDRGLAIEKALHLAEPGDSVMICGKGHEDYQEIMEQRVHFCDRAFAREVLRSMNFIDVMRSPDAFGDFENNAAMNLSTDSTEENSL